MVTQFATLLSLLFLAAHSLRDGSGWLAAFWLAAGGLLLCPWRLKHLTLSALLAFGTWLWIETTMSLVELRLSHDLPWLRLAAILGIACLLCFTAAILQGMKARQHANPKHTA